MAGTHVTREGIAKMEGKLKELMAQKRRLSKEVGVAMALGDLRENAEYHAAKERLQQVLEQIGDIEFKLSNVQVIDSSQFVAGIVTIGTRITLKELIAKKEETYLLVGSDESDPAARKISVHSPFAKFFIGKKVKEKVTVVLPSGSLTYQILSIQPLE